MIYYKMSYRIKVLRWFYQLTDVGALLLLAPKLKGVYIMNKWKIIDHTFKFRVGDSDEKGGCTFIGGEWKDVTTNELFKGKKIVMFSLPVLLHQLVQATTITVLYDEMYNKFKDKGIDDVYCISVNDAFVMNV